MEAQARITEWKAEYKRLLRDYPKNPKVVYLASCYRSARGEHGVDKYIHEASVLARKLWKIGLAVICPAKNTAFFGGMDCPDWIWLDGNSAFIRRCDGFVLHPNWETSAGAEAERQVAVELGLPIFYMPDQFNKLAHWAKGGNGLCQLTSTNPSSLVTADES